MALKAKAKATLALLKGAAFSGSAKVGVYDLRAPLYGARVSDGELFGSRFEELLCLLAL